MAKMRAYLIIFMMSLLSGQFCKTAEQFLNSLTNQQSSTVMNQQALQQKQQQAQEQRDVKNLHFIEKYYGNPEYQKAMKILHDTALQSQYEQSLNDLQTFFFEYTQTVLSSYHAPQTVAAKVHSQATSVSVTSFLNSIKSAKTEPSTPAGTVDVATGADNTGLFLNSIAKNDVLSSTKVLPQSLSEKLPQAALVVTKASKESPSLPVTSLMKSSLNSATSFLDSLKG